MDISVAICTWNRATLLRRTLAQMSSLIIPQEMQWELLVIDNNCTDNTAEVIAEFANELPVRRVYEPTQGLSHSRNRASMEAKGDLLLWTDDDVLVNEHWLEQYWNASNDSPEFSIFGGRIEPWFEGEPPNWLMQGFASVEIAYATRNLGETRFEFTNKQMPFGANFAIRVELQRKYLYDTKLGRKGHEMLSGEESAVIKAMLEDGHRGLWLGDAYVRHYIPTERQTVTYLRRYYEGHGITSSRKTELTSRTFWGRPWWLWRAWLTAEIRYRLHSITKSPKTWVEDLKLAAKWRGHMRGLGKRNA